MVKVHSSLERRDASLRWQNEGILESLQTYKAMAHLTVTAFEKWPFEKQLPIGIYSVHNGDNLFLISQ